MYLRYMSALEFNRWFLDQAVKSTMSDLTISSEQDMPEEAAAAAAPMNRNPGIPTHTDISIATTLFKGHV